eukprot:Clim_evm8s70 gene=Clim_evmTU8s70
MGGPVNPREWAVHTVELEHLRQKTELNTNVLPLGVLIADSVHYTAEDDPGQVYKELTKNYFVDLTWRPEKLLDEQDTTALAYCQSL